MNKSDLIQAVAEKSQLTKKDSEKAIEAVIDVVEEALECGDKVMIMGFGTFQVIKRAARKGRNPRTKEEINIPETKIPAFRAGKEFKDLIK